MPTPIERRRGVGEDLVVGDVVGVDVVASRPTHDASRQVADQRGDRDIDDVITEAPAVRPTTRHRNSLQRRKQRVAAEDAETREAGVVGVGRVHRTASRQPRGPGGQIDLDQIRDENADDILPAALDSGDVGSASTMTS